MTFADELDELLALHMPIHKDHQKDAATLKTSILKATEEMGRRVNGEYSQYPSHYTVSDVLAEQRTRLLNELKKG